ncbi:MAG: adenylosuccinate lyase [Candidatus Pacebacteria bacterium]|nr:adenylosuccinate lyase [Candidatus Paceibacterota bacterium]
MLELELEKYIKPEMGAIWTRQTRYSIWLEIELLIMRAQEMLGQFPQGVAADAKRTAKFTISEIDEEDKKNDQEMVSFLNVVKKTISEQAAALIHGGITSFDIWDTARAVQMQRSNALIEKELAHLVNNLRSMAATYVYAMMMGRTHGIHAEPMTFGLKILNWADELQRQYSNLRKRKAGFFVGKISGATGNYGNVDPQVEVIVCRMLGIGSARISNQIVARDRHYAWLTALAGIGNTLEKIALQIRLLQQTEISEVCEPFTAEGGSSAMPFKRNPNKSERVCSLARLPRVFTIVAGENQSLQWHERSLDESANERVIIPLTAAFIHYNLCLMSEIMVGLRVDTEKMLENLKITKGAIFSEDVMIALTKKGMDRRQARKIAKEDALEAWEKKEDFIKILEADPRVTNLLSSEEIVRCFDYDHYLKNIPVIFARFGIKAPVAKEEKVKI